MNRFVYVGRPVDALKAGGNDVRLALEAMEAQVEGSAAELGLGLFHPARAFSARGLDAGPEIRAINDAVLRQCAGMIALWPDGASSYGLPAEIESARRDGIPVVLVTGREQAKQFWSVCVDGVDVRSTVWEAMVLLQKRIQAREVQDDLSTPSTSSSTAVGPSPHWPDGSPKTPESIAAEVTGHTYGCNCLACDRAKAPTSAACRARLPVRVDGEGRLPQRGYPDDAGLDLVVSRSVVVRPKQFVDIECEVAVGLPPTHWGLILGRSSTVRKRGLLVCPGVIDPGYRGFLFAGVWNLTDGEVGVAAGERLAQFILFPNETRRFVLEQVSELEPTDRGVNGFGSTGT